MSNSINANLTVTVLLAGLSLCGCQTTRQEARPNIIWINAEDIGPAFGCYGDPFAHTPNIDRLAERSVVFRKTMAAAPICSPSRSALATGVNPTTLGTEHLRSETPIPEFIRSLPQHLRDAGYFATLYGKTDYNFDPEGMWEYWEPDETPWRKRPAGKPFFSVFTFSFTHEGKGNDLSSYEKVAHTLPGSLRHDPASATVPPFHPQTETMRRLWARYYDLIAAFDQQVGRMLETLKTDNLLDDTIIFIYSDHGFGLPGYKRWLRNAGLHVPLVVYIPDKYKHLSPHPPGSATDDLVSFVDFVPTALSLIGRPAPEYMHGKAFLGPDRAAPRQYAFAARSRADNVYDLARAVRTERFLYVRHFMPHLPYMQPGKIFSNEKEGFLALRQARSAGELPPAGESMFLPKPLEELYDLEQDPWELENLAAHAGYSILKDSLSKLLDNWIIQSRDLGFLPESEIKARLRGDTPYEMALDPARYDVETVYGAAKMVGTTDVNTYRRMLQHPDSGVQYWAVTGLHGAGREAREAAADLEKLLDASSKALQIAAAELLLSWGEHPKAVETLGKNLQDEDPDVALQAARSIELSANACPSLLHVVKATLKQKAAPPGSTFPYADYNHSAFISWSLESALKQWEISENLEKTK